MMKDWQEKNVSNYIFYEKNPSLVGIFQIHFTQKCLKMPVLGHK